MVNRTLLIVAGIVSLALGIEGYRLYKWNQGRSRLAARLTARAAADKSSYNSCVRGDDEAFESNPRTEESRKVWLRARIRCKANLGISPDEIDREIDAAGVRP